MKLLSIQIPTILGREAQYEKLFTYLNKQIELHPEIEIISLKDNKELTIGKKRQLLLESTEAEYFVQIDDDDSVPEYYIHEVLKALESRPDCVGYLESVIMNGQQKIACHSNIFNDWNQNEKGYDYVRTIFCKDIIKTDLAKKIGFSDIRFGEDHDFAKRLKNSKLLIDEYFINKIMYYYSHNSLTTEQHKQRYGL